MRGRLLKVAAATLLLALALGAAPAVRHAQAARMLSRFMAADQQATADVEERPLTLENGVAAREYLPRGIASPPALVLVHGVHHKGIDEPRLQRFARALAGAGIKVLTPQIRELADYRIAPKSIDTIGAAVRQLRSSSGGRPVGLMGLSFAGGLCLLAAADPRFQPDVRFVAAIGAHHDLARVLRYFATDQDARPDGTTQTLKAHDYGVLVLAHTHVEDFFEEADRAAASEALEHALRDERGGAETALERLSPPGQERLRALLDRNVKAVAPELLAAVVRHQAELERVSPHGHLGQLTAPVLLLHGEGDNVIPAAETLWLASEVPPPLLRQALVSAAIQHVELQGTPGLWDDWLLVHFMAETLGAARERSGASPPTARWPAW
jgi:dienelactone hydrolase